MKIRVVISGLLLLATAAANASLIASDNAGNYTAWTNNSNGGTGFGPWTLQTTGPNAGHFLGLSTGNAGGSGGIREGNSWGMWANSGDTAEAFRPLTGGALGVGQAFLVDMDNGWIESGRSVGWGLQNSSGGNLFEFGFTGGGSTYWINDSDSGYDTGISFTGDGLRFRLTLTGTGSYALQVISGSSTSVFNRTLASGGGDQGIVRFHAWNYSAGSGSNYDAFWDNMAVIPEPGTWVLAGIGVVSCVALRRRLPR